MSRASEWASIGERCDKVDQLRGLAKAWLVAGDPEQAGGRSYWEAMEKTMLRAIARHESQFSTGDDRLSDEDSALLQAVIDMRQDIWRRAGELLLQRAQQATDDARKAAATALALCDEIEGKK